MGADLEGYLKGLKPEENDAMEALKGVYATVCNGYSRGLNKFNGDDQFSAEFQIVEVIDGNGNAGRKFCPKNRNFHPTRSSPTVPRCSGK